MDPALKVIAPLLMMAVWGYVVARERRRKAWRDALGIAPPPYSPKRAIIALVIGGGILAAMLYALNRAFS
jgi:hypothetical protein